MTNILLFIFVIIVVFILFVNLAIRDILLRFTNKNKGKEKNLIITLSLSASTVLIIFSGFAPYFFTSTTMGKAIIAGSETGLIGDTMGGIMNPFIAVAAALLTFLAFWIQYKANEQQKKDLQVERFENKFYEMLKIHRENVNETTIGKSLAGRKSFISMFNELKFTYHSVKWYYDTYHKSGVFERIDEDTLYNISYLIFFFGIGNNSSLIVKDLIGSKHLAFFKLIEIYLEDVVKIWRLELKKGEPIAVKVDEENDFHLKIGYVPFNGQMSKLSHYIRHLFQIVKFVDDADDNIFDYESKYNYISSIRSQLSAHEQLLLFYNAVSVLGKPWLDEPNYLRRYCVIKSCPLPLANFYKNPLEILGEVNEHGKIMFEWIDIKTRLNS